MRGSNFDSVSWNYGMYKRAFRFFSEALRVILCCSLHHELSEFVRCVSRTNCSVTCSYREIRILILVNCSPFCYTTSYPPILPFKWQDAGSGHSAWTFCGGWPRITRV